MLPSINNNFSREFNEKQGITMWNGKKGNGVPGNGEGFDENVVFKIFTDSTSYQNVLYLRGTGIFEGGTSGITANLKDAEGKSYSVDNLVFKAGDGFGVTTDGTIYANKGKIGNLEIGDIASTGNVEEAVNNIEIGGKNLYISSSTFSNTDWKHLDGWSITSNRDSFGNIIAERSGPWSGLY
jgi:hypothetical protein